MMAGDIHKDMARADNKHWGDERAVIVLKKTLQEGVNNLQVAYLSIHGTYELTGTSNWQWTCGK